MIVSWTVTVYLIYQSIGILGDKLSLNLYGTVTRIPAIGFVNCWYEPKRFAWYFCRANNFDKPKGQLNSSLPSGQSLLRSHRLEPSIHCRDWEHVNWESLHRGPVKLFVFHAFLMTSLRRTLLRAESISRIKLHATSQEQQNPAVTR